MDPTAIQFTTAPGKSCAGCIWEHERSTVCHEAARVAVRSGMLDCEYERVIYVLKQIDTRQTSLI